jgi:hypothetical protein
MSFLGQFKAVENPEFYGRVWMACYKAADDVLNEDINTPNHGARVDFANRIQLDPVRYAKPLVRACAMNPTIGATPSTRTASPAHLMGTCSTWSTPSGTAPRAGLPTCSP